MHPFQTSDLSTPKNCMENLHLRPNCVQKTPRHRTPRRPPAWAWTRAVLHFCTEASSKPKAFGADMDLETKRTVLASQTVPSF